MVFVEQEGQLEDGSTSSQRGHTISIPVCMQVWIEYIKTAVCVFQTREQISKHDNYIMIIPVSVMLYWAALYQ